MGVAGTAVLPPPTSVPKNQMSSAVATNAQTRAWVFTLNNPERTSPIPPTEDPLTWGATYVVFQLERGESGTPHLQGYCLFPSNRRLAALRRLAPKAHWEPRRGSHEQARDYCRKEEGRVDGPWEQGEQPAPGKRNDLTLAMADVKAGMSEKDIAEKYGGTWARNYNALQRYRNLVTDHRNWKTEVTVLYGAAGTGKSRYACENHPRAYPFRAGDYWCGYDGHADVVIDDFTAGCMRYGHALHVFDRYPLIVDVKHGSGPFLARRIIITSNTPPHLWYPNCSPDALLRRLDNIIYVSLAGTPHVVKGRLEYPFVGTPSVSSSYLHAPAGAPASSSSSSSSETSSSSSDGSHGSAPLSLDREIGSRSSLLVGPTHFETPRGFAPHSSASGLSRLSSPRGSPFPPLHGGVATTSEASAPRRDDRERPPVIIIELDD